MLKRFALFTLSLFAVMLFTISAEFQTPPVLQVAIPAIGQDQQLTQAANRQASRQASRQALMRST